MKIFLGSLYLVMLVVFFVILFSFEQMPMNMMLLAGAGVGAFVFFMWAGTVTGKK